MQFFKPKGIYMVMEGSRRDSRVTLQRALVELLGQRLLALDVESYEWMQVALLRLQALRELILLNDEAREADDDPHPTGYG
jgi:predicted protein tyrosine phosphatase